MSTARFALALLVTLVSASTLAVETPKPAPKRPPSSIATLKSLNLSPGKMSPKFGTRRLKYTDVVRRATQHITLTALTTDPAAKITVKDLGAATGTLITMAPLFSDTNRIALVVVAPDGKTSKTYQITVKRR